MPVPKEHIKQMLKLYYDNAPLKEIAEVIGVPEGTIKARLITARKKYGLVPRPSASAAKLNMIEMDKVIICNLYRRKECTYKIAEAYGVGSDTIRNYLIRWGQIQLPYNEEFHMHEMAFENLRRNWKTIEEPVVVTVRGVPSFVLQPVQSALTPQKGT